MDDRRKLVIVLGAGALAAPFGVFAQQAGKVWRIGILSSSSSPTRFEEAFRDELRILGYIEGRNLSIEYRGSAGDDARLPELAAELVQLKVDVILTNSGSPPAAAKRATSTIPIVTAATADPVGQGLIASLARPGGNLTGLSMLSTDLTEKRVQMLREFVPKATRIAVLAMKGTSSTPPLLANMRTVAQQMGLTLIVQEVNEPEALPGAFAAMQSAGAQLLIVQQAPFTATNRKLILELAAKYRLPGMFDIRLFVDGGGLISYGPSLPDLFRRAAHYVDKIFKGAKPADLPVEQPTKFELFINRKTAKALGLTIPQALLLSADEVIE
jgi:putative ABC transport system substrate-binding protein